MVVLATISTVALVAVVAAVAQWRHRRRVRKQTCRALALLDRHAEDWASVTAGVTVHGHADRSGKRLPERSVPDPRWRTEASSSPRHALSATAHHRYEQGAVRHG